jgi:hypothetical protein
MKPNIPYSEEATFPHRPFHALLKAGLPNSAPAAPSTRPPMSAVEGAPLPPGVMPWGAFAAYAAALASTGFLFVMLLAGGIHLG